MARKDDKKRGPLEPLRRIRTKQLNVLLDRYMAANGIRSITELANEHLGMHPSIVKEMLTRPDYPAKPLTVEAMAQVLKVDPDVIADRVIIPDIASDGAHADGLNLERTLKRRPGGGKWFKSALNEVLRRFDAIYPGHYRLSSLPADDPDHRAALAFTLDDVPPEGTYAVIQVDVPEGEIDGILSVTTVVSGVDVTFDFGRIHAETDKVWSYDIMPRSRTTKGSSGRPLQVLMWVGADDPRFHLRTDLETTARVLQKLSLEDGEARLDEPSDELVGFRAADYQVRLSAAARRREHEPSPEPQHVP